MPNLLLLQWSSSIVGTIFAFMFGAVAGSFINVLVYRLPRGLNIITPPSACPRCQTRLTWRENFPILGWILLRGKCRSCKEPISPEYPIVETIVALLFALLYALWFFDSRALDSVGIDLAAWRPAWTILELRRMLPALIVTLSLVGTLVAITIIDARTFMIPLALPWFATVVGVIIHPLHAWWISGSTRNLDWAFPEWGWVIPPVPIGHPEVTGATFGAVLGLALSVLALQLGWIRRSFADYEAWEAEHAQAPAAPGESPAVATDPPIAPESEALDVRALLLRTFFLTGPAIALLGLGYAYAMATGQNPLPFTVGGMVIGLLVGSLLRRVVAQGEGDSQEPLWVQYPHARREMGVELLFLSPCILLGLLGWWLGGDGGALHGALSGLSLPIRVLAGAMAGYLVGGGLIWGVRIFGTLAFGKEAMGLGDVHLLGAVGAALGWISPLLAFFSALFLGIGWAMLSVFSTRLFKREGTALPFGPHLAAAALLTLYLRPVYEWALSVILGGSVMLP